MNETLVKYLAGLLDADSTIQFIYRPVVGGWNLQVHMSLDAAESIDKHGFVPSLPELTGLGTVTNRKRDRWAKVHTWHVCKRSEIEQILPRLIKHMVLKDGHFQWCLDMLRNTKGTTLTERQVEQMKVAITTSRKLAPHLKEHVHPTWAWTAGFLDGDGYYSLRTNQKTGRITCRMGAVCHKDDRVTLDLLHKAFGGSLYAEQDWIRWHRNLGPRDANFSSAFLAKMVKHSRLKRHKIESIIHSNKQRLSKKRPAG